MKKTMLTLAITGAVLGWIGCAQATTISIYNVDTDTASIDNWIAAQGGLVTVLEDFENVEIDSYNTLTSSNLGTFSALSNYQFKVRNDDNYGRSNSTPGGENYLDSNDLTNITLEMDSSQSLFNLFFYIQDPADGWPIHQGTTASATTLMAFDNNGLPASYTFTGSTATHGDPSLNAQRWFVGITTDTPLLEIDFTVNNPYDGYGLDDFSTVTQAPVPEPATMLLFGAGLVGLAACRRKKA